MVRNFPSTTRLVSQWIILCMVNSATKGDAPLSKPTRLDSTRVLQWLERKPICSVPNRKILLNVWLLRRISEKQVKRAVDCGKEKMNSTYTSRNQWQSMKCARPDLANAISNPQYLRCQAHLPVWMSWSNEMMWRETAAKLIIFKERRVPHLTELSLLISRHYQAPTIQPIIQCRTRSNQSKRETR